MGNLCSRGANSDNFRGEGRTLGSSSNNAPAAPRPTNTAPPAPSIAKITSSTTKMGQQQSHTQGPGRTLGSATEAGGGGVEDARARAARAAEERAKNTQGTGKLAQQLQAQKKQTRSETLAAASRENRGARDADEGHDARAWN